jgi:hypothetical protein
MQPYVIKRGDFLALLAHQFGFDADTVWNDPANDDLRKIRTDPNILAPTDVLYIPDPPDEPVTHALTMGSTNSFTVTVPTMNVTFVFADPSCASQPYTVQELPDLTGMSSDSSGSITFTTPIDIGMFTVEFTGAGLSFTCGVGYLDPINTFSGVIQRLQNLGYLESTESPDAVADVTAVRDALRRLKAAQAAPSSAASSAPSSSAPPSSAPPSSAPPSSAPPSSAPPSSAPPSSAPPSSNASPDSDDQGLSDDGTLDDATSKVLLDAYGF